MNVDEAVQSFLVHARTERRVSERTLRAYGADLAQFSTAMSGREMTQITTSDIETWLESLRAHAYRASTLLRRMAAVKVFLHDMERRGVIAVSPARAIRSIVRTARTRPKILTPRELGLLLAAPRRLIEQIANHRNETPAAATRYFTAVRDSLVLEFLFSTGIRVGELVSLDCEDVDLVAREVRVRGRRTRRIVALTSDALVLAISEYLKLRGTRTTETTALFIGRAGQRLTIFSTGHIFRKYARLASLRPGLTPHSLRHTFASMLLMGGADLHHVQEMLGHASILSTKVYTKPGRRAPAGGGQARGGKVRAARGASR